MISDISRIIECCRSRESNEKNKALLGIEKKSENDALKNVSELFLIYLVLGH